MLLTPTFEFWSQHYISIVRLQCVKNSREITTKRCSVQPLPAACIIIFIHFFFLFIRRFFVFGFAAASVGSVWFFGLFLFRVTVCLCFSVSVAVASALLLETFAVSLYKIVSMYKSGNPMFIAILMMRPGIRWSLLFFGIETCWLGFDFVSNFSVLYPFEIQVSTVVHIVNFFVFFHFVYVSIETSHLFPQNSKNNSIVRVAPFHSSFVGSEQLWFDSSHILSLELYGCLTNWI